MLFFFFIIFYFNTTAMQNVYGDKTIQPSKFEKHEMHQYLFQKGLKEEEKRRKREKM